MVLLMFVATVRDMGAGQYLVQERELTIERIRAVWAVKLGLGLALAGVVLLASYPVALFYKEPRMRDIMLVVSGVGCNRRDGYHCSCHVCHLNRAKPGAKCFTHSSKKGSS